MYKFTKTELCPFVKYYSAHFFAGCPNWKEIFFVLQSRQKIQGLQAFAFCVVNLTMNIQNLGSKESLVVKFKDGICAELCLKLLV